MLLKGTVAVTTLVALICLGSPVRVGPVRLGAGVAVAATETEEDLVSRGVKLRKTGNDIEAAEVFRKAYERFHTPRSAAQLGLAEQALGRWEDAETHVTEALRADDDAWVQRNREALRSAMVVIKEHIARIEILGEPAGAEILVNGRPVGRLPLSRIITTSAGEVDIEARAAGWKREVRKVTLTGGQYQRLVMRMEKDTPATTATTGTPRTDAVTPVSEPAHPVTQGGDGGSGAVANGGEGADAGQQSQPVQVRPVLKWTALGLAVASVGVGVGASIVRSNKLAEFGRAHDGDCEDRNRRGVDKNTGMEIGACQGPLDTYYTARTWQVVGFVSAGVFAAAWAALMLTESDDAPATATARRGNDGPRLLACGLFGDLRGATCTLAF